MIGTAINLLCAKFTITVSIGFFFFRIFNLTILLMDIFVLNILLPGVVCLLSCCLRLVLQCPYAVTI